MAEEPTKEASDKPKTDYQGNSQKAKATTKPEGQTDKKLEKIVTAPVKIQKKSFGSKIKNAIVMLDLKGMAGYVFREVAVPGAQNWFFDVMTKSVEKITYPRGRRYPGPPGRPGSHFTYNTPIERSYRPPGLPQSFAPRPTQGSRTTSRRSSEDVIFSTLEEAEAVVEMLNNITSEYDVATLGDLYELLGLEVNPVHHKWGWAGIVDAPITQNRDGFRVEFPPVEPIS